MDRRQFVCGAAAGFTMAAGMPSNARSNTTELHFKASRNDSEIGFHRFTFERDGGTLVVRNQAVFEIKIAFITFFAYEHENREIWQDGLFMGCNSRTDNDGEKLQVDVLRDTNGFNVKTLEGAQKVSGELVPSTYWHRSFLDVAQWVNTQDGKLIDHAAKPAGTEEILADGKMIAADRFDLAGDLPVSLWYAGDDWVKLRATAVDGSMIDYVLERSSPVDYTPVRG